MALMGPATCSPVLCECNADLETLVMQELSAQEEADIQQVSCTGHLHSPRKIEQHMRVV